MSETDARSYLRYLGARHLSMVLFPFGILLAITGVGGLGGPMIAMGFVGWCLAIVGQWFRVARRNSGMQLIGGDSIAAEVNWWSGWGPMAEAAAVTGRDPATVRRLAIGSVVATFGAWALVILVGALG